MKLVEPKIESLNNSVNSFSKFEGWQIQKAPRPVMTAPDTNQATGTYSTGTAAIINNLQTRINELETILIQLNLLKSR